MMGSRLCFVAPWPVIFASALFAVSSPAQERPGRFVAPVTSPEVDAERQITFRIRAESSEKVRISGNDLPAIGRGQALTRSEDGVWEIKLGPVKPGAYRYRFEVDGVPVIDPSNASVSESNGNAWSLVYVPGASWMDTNRVPHGAVAEITYFSEALNRFRRMHVYTPPGYEANQQDDYPVLYLLHGAFDCDDSWTTVGRAGFILDNLIADGNAKPMIVVMPAGHTGPFMMGRGRPAEDEFTLDFVKAIVPYVESNYRVRPGRENRALAGLSMGGGQTLNIAINHLDQYAYLGVFSSGVFGITGPGPGNQDDPSNRPSWEETYRPALSDGELKQGIKLFWFATGEDDFLLETTRATVDLLNKYDFDVTYRETDGGHTWTKWREYLHEFSQHLFRENVTPAKPNDELSSRTSTSAFGKWSATFGTRIGPQFHVFDFQPNDGGFARSAMVETNDR